MADLLEMIREDYPKLDMAVIEKAYRLAKQAHVTQTRESGEPYFVHPCEVAKILLGLGMDTDTIVAGLLHDVVEDTNMTKEELQQEFGEEVALLVDGVTKISRLQFDSREEQQAESLRKMLLAMAKDVRVVLIRLADRLHNMRTLTYCSREKQVRVARETLDIYAPLAHRLGIYSVKAELEDLALSYLDPTGYRELARLVNMRRQEREESIQEIIAIIRDNLDRNGMEATIEGRPKHFYSIYRKMKTQQKSFDQIYDLTAIRVIVDTVKDCYGVLGIIHTIWKPIPGRFKDYIAMPKPNQYQSLHTTLIGKQGIPFEVQVRTYEMHRVAEFGIAAHWKYKEQRADTSDVDARLQWLRQVLEWQNETSDSLEFINTLKVDLFSDQVFVFTPKGKVIDLPKGANAIDFAYRIHSQIGNKCVGVKINGKMVPLDTPLSTGDIVEVITSNSSKGPSRDWLGMAKTPQARSKIRAWFKKERREENVEKGRAMLESAAKRLTYSLPQLMKPEWLESIYQRFSINSLEDLYAAIGYGGLTSNQVLSRLLEEHRNELRAQQEAERAAEMTSEEKQQEEAEKRQAMANSHGVIVKGEPGMLVRFAKCCNPVPQDPIVGFITVGRGVSIHRADCSNLMGMGEHPERFIEVAWGEDVHTSSYNAEIHLEAMDRPGLLVDISNIIQSMNVKLISITARVGKENTANMQMVVSISSKQQLENMIKQFKKMPEMMKVFRVNA